MNTKMINILLFAMLVSTSAYAKTDIKEEIIKRCRAQMAQYGPSLIKACVDQDIEAVISLSNLMKTKKYNSIISRCMNQMQDYGYNLVKACVDQDIKAEEALNNY